MTRRSNLSCCAEGGRGAGGSESGAGPVRTAGALVSALALLALSQLLLSSCFFRLGAEKAYGAKVIRAELRGAKNAYKDAAHALSKPDYRAARAGRDSPTLGNGSNFVALGHGGTLILEIGYPRPQGFCKMLKKPQ